MDKAKSKVNEFLHKSGKHDTTVHESVNPAVTHETVKPHQHEHTTTAVDREVRQDHHHTSVQPVHDKQILPEQHHLREHGAVSKEFKHGNDEQVHAKLQQERAQFKDHSTTAQTTSSHEEGPVVTGEHVHHNIHEVIQPVVHRETVEPHVVHNVNKVHEKHDNPAKVHETSTLPAMNMSDFKAHGGSLTGRETRTDGFAGEPHRIGGTNAAHNQYTSGVTGTGHSDTHHTTGTTRTNHTTGAPHHTSGTDHTPGPHVTPGHGPTASHPHRADSDDGHKKPSLADKLNPKVDADGDGKAGIMS